MLLFLSTFFAVMAMAGAAFQVLSLIGLRDWRRQPGPPSGVLTPVSILKPLKGCDAEMYECLRSHCEQEYPEFEIIFGVNSADDEAVAFVERLQREYPQRAISLVVCENELGANRKVSNLVQMLTRARYGHVLINDSDILVPRRYLAEVMSWFNRAGVGLVTCLYTARGGTTLWARLESLGILTDFMPGVLSARTLEGECRFGLGSTLALDKNALEKTGGLEPLVDVLADDYQLGNRMRNHNFEVVVPNVIVRTTMPDYTFRDFWHHQVRWARTVRSSRPLEFGLGIPVTFALFWACLAVITGPEAWWTWSILAVVLALRGLVLLRYGRALRAGRTLGRFLLLPLRDLLSPVFWLVGVGGDRIVWRGERFVVSRGKLRRDL
ncbi:MAG: bacteriohopanetetrol glucosamine biosynthesis glycosyltransferase HpnI [Acidobacteriales bacterium]|nr:bacteriohopanetetrol glucosamine biosynthesis glycosyltransferase HpnI [Terriglobales bacterium]